MEKESHRRDANTPGKRGREDPLCVALHKTSQNLARFMIFGYIEVYVAKRVLALIFEDYLQVVPHLSRICSASFIMQIIYNSLYQSPLFQYKFDACHPPLCNAQRDPLGIRLWICFSLLANGVQKGQKTGAINLGLSVN